MLRNTKYLWLFFETVLINIAYSFRPMIFSTKQTILTWEKNNNSEEPANALFVDSKSTSFSSLRFLPLMSFALIYDLHIEHYQFFT